MKNENVFIKLVEIDDYQVAFIDRGEDENDPTLWKLELVTKVDDITVSAILSVPTEKSEAMFEAWGEASAKSFLEQARAIVGQV